MKRMTKKEFLAVWGMKCPNCRSRNVNFTPIGSGAFEVDYLYRDVQCRKCSATWVEVYSLTGYDNFKKGEMRHDSDTTRKGLQFGGGYDGV